MKTTKTTKSTVAVVNVSTLTKENTMNVAKPIRRKNTTTVMTRDINTLRKIKCPECGGHNGLARMNQPCDHCGFMLSVKLFPNHDNYIKGLGVTVSGRDTYDIGDDTADVLRGLSEDMVINYVASALAQLPIDIGLSKKVGKQFANSGYDWNTTGIQQWLSDRNEGRNPGMLRMNCGNILRNAKKRENDDINA
jgi:ribosomal protein L37E